MTIPQHSPSHSAMSSLSCSFASVNKKKASSSSTVCLIFLILSLPRESNCQDKQNESRSFHGRVSLSAPLQIPRLFACTVDAARSGTAITSNDSVTTDSSRVIFDDTKDDNNDLQLHASSLIQIQSSNFTLQLLSEDRMCPKSLQKRVFLLIDEEEEALPESNNSTIKLLANGYLKINRENFAPDEFCVDKFNESHVEVMVCPMNCTERLCVRKCCSADKLFSFNAPTRERCQLPRVDPFLKFQPTLYHDYSTKLTKSESAKMPMPHFTEYVPSMWKQTCTGQQTVISPFSSKMKELTGKPFNALTFRMRKDGKILYRHTNGKCAKIEEFQSYCFEGFQDYNNVSEEAAFRSSEDDMILVTCSDGLANTMSVEHDAVSKYIGIIMIVTSLFPFLTTVVYVMLWKKQTVHGWTIVSTSTSLLFMYIFIGSSHIIRLYYQTKAHDTTACVIVAVGAHFFFLATFTWLTVMCCDLWWTFRTLTPKNRRSKGYKRFFNYSLFGWGVPTVVIVVALIIHHMEDNCNDYLILPAYGRQSCYLSERSMGVYLYYPGMLLLLINIVFFSVTCIKLYQYRQSCQMNYSSFSFSRFAKLFCVMGVTWIFEIVSWVIDGLGWTWYWIIFDTINILRAFAVFLIYVCKWDILNALEDSYPRIKKFVPQKQRQHSSAEITNTTGLASNAIQREESSVAL